MIKPGNLLIVRTDRIGDVILTLPLAGIIKEHYPDCKISFLVKEYTAPLLYGSAPIDQIISLPEESGKLKFLQALRILKKNKFDSALVVRPTFLVALLMLLAGIKFRIGTGYRWYSFLFNKKIYEHRKYAEFHELEYNVHLLKYFDIIESINRSNVKYNISIDSRSELKIQQLLLEHIKDQSLPIIIFHPGSAGSAADLPVSKMKELIHLTAQGLNVNIVLTGNKQEIEICRQLTGEKNVVNFAGMLNLEELKALINKAALLIANSTGPIHIASALGKNVIGFYPKVKACSPERWGPYTEKAAVFQPKLECENCTIEKCKELDCMSSIEMNEVFEQVRKVINGNI